MATHLVALSFDSPIPTRRPPPTARPIEPITNPTEAYVLLHRYQRPPTPTRRPTPTHPPTPTRRPTPTPRPLSGREILAGLPAQVTLATEVFYFPLGMQDYWYKDYTWKGVGAHKEHDLTNLKVNWWHGWGDGDITAEMSTDNKRKLAPIRFCPQENDYARANAASAAAEAAQRYPGRVWLLYNEPEFPYVCDQTECGYPTPPPTPTPGPCMMCYHNNVQEEMRASYPGFDDSYCVWQRTTPTPVYVANGDLIDAMAKVTADDYAALYEAIKGADPTARVFCCGNFYTYLTEWWEAFLGYLQTNHPGVKLDGVHLHTYPWTESTNCYDYEVDIIWEECLKRKLETFLGFHDDHPLTAGKPIWITEYGYLGRWNSLGTPQPTPDTFDVKDYLMRPLAGWIGQGEHHYTGVAWFVTYGDPSKVPPETWLLDPPYPPSVLTTPVGAEWAGYPDDTYPPTATPTPAS